MAHTSLFSYWRRVHLGTKKEAWKQCKGASFQAGQKKSALAECLCLALVKTSIWKKEVNEECSVWEDWYMVWSPARQAFRVHCCFTYPVKTWVLPHFWILLWAAFIKRTCREYLLFSNLSFHSLFLAVFFTCSQAESAADDKLSCFALFWPPTPAPVFSSFLCSAVIVFHGGFALADLQPLLMHVLVWELLQTLCCE